MGIESKFQIHKKTGKILEMDVKAKAHWKPTHFQCGSQNDYANRDGDANESMMCVLGKHPGVGAV